MAWLDKYSDETPKGQKGKKVKPTLYVDSKNHPRYKAYRDSLSLYNKTKDIQNPKYYSDGSPSWYTWKGDTESAEKFMIKNNIDVDYEYYRTNKFPGRIQPIKTGDFGEGMAYPIYKKPTQPVEIKRPILENINITPKGLAQTNTELSPNFNIIQQARTPKYFKVKDRVNQPFGGTEIQYRNYPDQVLPSMSTQTYPDGTPMNTRQVVPVYMEGGEIPVAQNGIEGTMGGLTDKGFNYNGAWGGQFQEGGEIPNAQNGWFQSLKSTLNPYNWGVEDYSKYKTKDKAYSAARKAGEKEFMFNNKRYNTKYAGTPKEQLKQTGITDDQIQGTGFIKDRLYKNLKPVGYENPGRRVYDAVVKNKKDDQRDLASYGRLDAFNLYMGVPQTHNTFEVSDYKPSISKGNDDNTIYYKKSDNAGEYLEDQLGKKSYSDYMLEFIGDDGKLIDKTKKSRYDEIAGNYTINLGKDDKGNYISYYDKWDLNPYELKNPITGKEITTDIGKPFEIYDRIYYQDNPKYTKEYSENLKKLKRDNELIDGFYDGSGKLIGKQIPNTFDVEYTTKDGKKWNVPKGFEDIDRYREYLTNELNKPEEKRYIPKRQMGGNIYPVNYVPQAQDGYRMGTYFDEDARERETNMMEETYDDYNTAMTGMMKSKMATQAALGNKGAQRMMSSNPSKYIFTGNERFSDGSQAEGAGAYGTHYMSNRDNYVYPNLQDNGEGTLNFIPNASPSDREAMRFESPGEADYFANHYKEVAPMMKHYNKLAMGGSIPGAVGFTYARTQGIPSEGKYAKKTLPSAQNGVDMYGNPIIANIKRDDSVTRTNYNPRTNTIIFGSDQPLVLSPEILEKTLAHENRHAWQFANDRTNFDIVHNPEYAFQERLKKRPELMSTDEVFENYHNRKAIESQLDVERVKANNPSLALVPNDIIYNKIVDHDQYSNPNSVEGEAEYYQNTGTSFQNGGEMSYYQHGLDFTPKGMQNGGWLDAYGDDVPKAQVGFYSGKQQKPNVNLANNILKNIQQRKKQAPEKVNVRETPRTVAKDNTAVKKVFNERKFDPNARNKTEQEIEQEIINDRRARIADSIAAQNEDVIGNPNWREVLARQTQAIGDKFRISEKPNFFDDWLNPGVWIGDMSSALGQAPYQAKETDSYIPYVTSIGLPLLTGGIEGIGAKSTGQFVNNLVNPFNIVPGYKSAEKYIGNKLKGVGKNFKPNASIINEAGNTYNLAKPNAYNYPGVIKEHLGGIGQGLDDVITGRPFFEAFPITKAQKETVYLAQDKARKEGVDFVNDWYYKNGQLRPEVKRRIDNIYFNEASNAKGSFDENPLGFTENKLVSSRSSELPFENISNESKNYLETNRGNIAGFNSGITNESITLRNQGFYNVNPKEIKNTVIHEAGHSAQDIGDNFPWGNLTTQYSPELKYYTSNPDTNIGKRFRNALRTPGKASGNSYHPRTWKSSPNELHSELMSARSNVYDDFLKQGKSPEEAMSLLQNPSNETLDALIKQGNLNRFFKQSRWGKQRVPIETRRDLIKLLPALAPVAAGVGALEGQEEVPQQKQGGVIKDDRGQWAHPGEITEIGSNNITMQGVPYPVLGISDTGDVQMMYPGEDYEFDGESVTEFPMARNGINNLDAKPLQKLNQLTNFTNYNRNSQSGWLDKFDEGGTISSEKDISIKEYGAPYPEPQPTKPDVTVAPEELIDPIKPDGGYVVSKGDTLSKIAKETGVSVRKIAQANNIKDVNRISVGQELVIPSNAVKALPEKYQNWEVIKKKTNDLNKLGDLQKIVKYHERTPDEVYSVVDKKNAKLNIYKGTQLIKSFEIGVGANPGDAQTVTKKVNGKTNWDSGNKSTGAGIYTISNVDPASDEYYGLPSFNLKNEQGIEVATSIHGTPTARRKYFNNNTVTDNRMSNGCINGKCQDLPEMYKYLEEGSKVYILPEDKGNRFEIVDGKPAFRVDPKNAKKYETYVDKKGVKHKGQGVNRSTNTLVYKPIKAVFNEEKFKDEVFTTFDFNDEKEYNKTTKPFVRSLTDNKQKIMKAAQIPSDVYNEIAKMAFGIYGTESNFGDTHSALGNFSRAIGKAIDPKSSSSPDYESKYNTYGADEDYRSAGLTQVRWSYLNDKEKSVLKKLGITSNKDMLDPKKAAIATTAILGVRYNEQLNSEQKKDVWKYLPTKWNKRGNYADRVKSNSSYLNFQQLNPIINKKK